MEENNSNEYCSDVIVVGEMVGFAYQSFHYLGQYSDLKHINTDSLLTQVESILEGLMES